MAMSQQPIYLNSTTSKTHTNTDTHIHHITHTPQWEVCIYFYSTVKLQIGSLVKKVQEKMQFIICLWVIQI